MTVTLRDFITFPFNGGRGVRASQIADVDVPALHQSVDDIMSGRLGYTWRYAIGFRSQTFREQDFVHQMHSAASEFPELELPEFTETDTYFGAMAIPLEAPEAYLERDSGFASDVLAGSYRRVREPLYINGAPHRVYVGRPYLTSRESGADYVIKPRLRLSRYPRYAVATTTSAVPAFGADWIASRSPVLQLGDFGGQARYVHVAIPHGTVTPDIIAAAEAGAANVAGSFTLGSSLEMIDGVPHAVYTSNAALGAAAYSGKKLVVLPERAGIQYYEPPTEISDEALGFTWYAGFYSWPKVGSHPLAPVTEALVNAGAGVSSSAMRQLVMPADGDGGVYQPDSDRHYVRFVAWPSGQDAITGLYSVPAITYDSQEEIDSRATRLWDLYYTEQPGNPVAIGGVNYDVFLNRATTRSWSSSPRSGERFHVINGGM